jgi:formylmethanofuran dehydrogenase subunit C
VSLTLHLRETPPGRISLAGLTPDRLGALSMAEIERLPLAWGNERLRVADLFRVEGEPCATLRFEGGHPRFADIGGGMAGGVCEVFGDGGDFLARAMRGGRLEVFGSAGSFAASGLTGGDVIIHGNAGDRLGAAMPWLGAGMAGGRVVVHGNVGERCGDKLRRGEIFIGGDAGAFCGTRLVAGSIAVAGRVGGYAGYAMRRGTLLLLGGGFAPAPTFAETVAASEAYLGLLWRHWRSIFGGAGPFAAFAQRAIAENPAPRRWLGDLAEAGRGEILLFEP